MNKLLVRLFACLIIFTFLLPTPVAQAGRNTVPSQTNAPESDQVPGQFIYYLPLIMNGTATVAPLDSTVPATAAYDLFDDTTLDIAMTLNGNTLTSIAGGDITLVPDDDYTLHGNTVTLTEAYMQAQAVGEVTLTFTFSAGVDDTCVITVSDTTPAVPTALITSSTYDFTTGNLVLTGVNFNTGAAIDVTKLTITGYGTTTLTVATANPTPTSATSATVVVAGADKAATVGPVLNKNGTASSDFVTYNLRAGIAWQPGAAVDDVTPITVSGH